MDYCQVLKNCHKVGKITDESPLILITCSGVSNTGKLTTQAALTLLQRRPGCYVWMHARQSTATLEADIKDAKQVIVIDGCEDCCAKKKLSASCLAPYHHIIATELGIQKKGMGEVQFDEIETVVRAVLNSAEIKRYDTTTIEASRD